jgi:hypothetical protein
MTDELTNREEILFKNLVLSHWVNIVQVTFLGALVVFLAWRQSTSERFDELVEVVTKIEQRVGSMELKVSSIEQLEPKINKVESSVLELKKIIQDKHLPN